MDTLRIALIARMGSGKTELTKRLVKHCAGIHLSFGTALKEQVLSYGLVEGGKIDKARDRAVLQNFGQFRRTENKYFQFYNGYVYRHENTGFIRYDRDPDAYNPNVNWSIGECYPDYWVDALEARMRPYLDKFIPLFNDDIRRENERAMLKRLGFTVVKINVQDEIRLERLRSRDGSFDPATLDDVSEKYIDTLPFDAEIDNNGTIEDAWAQLIETVIPKDNPFLLLNLEHNQWLQDDARSDFLP